MPQTPGFWGQLRFPDPCLRVQSAGLRLCALGFGVQVSAPKPTHPKTQAESVPTMLSSRCGPDYVIGCDGCNDVIDSSGLGSFRAAAHQPVSVRWQGTHKAGRRSPAQNGNAHASSRVSEHSTCRTRYACVTPCFPNPRNSPCPPPVAVPSRSFPFRLPSPPSPDPPLFRGTCRLVRCCRSRRAPTSRSKRALCSCALCTYNPVHAFCAGW